MKKVYCFILALTLLAACAPIVPGTSGDNQTVMSIPSITNSIPQTELSFGVTEFTIWLKLIGVEQCLIKGEVVTGQTEPLTLSLSTGWSIKGDSDFDLNLGMLAACKADAMGTITVDGINQSLTFIYGYVAKASGLGYVDYVAGVEKYGTAISQHVYETPLPLPGLPVHLSPASVETLP